MSFPMKPSSETSARTLGHYNTRPDQFWEGTRDHDVSQNIDALISALPPSLSEDVLPHILDFGCGPGRDVKAFADRGFQVTGLDGSEAFCQMARRHSGQPVLHQDFLDLDLADNTFDGVFANASLFHVPSASLGSVLSALYAALKPRGVLFSSNPRGQNGEGYNGERYAVYHDLERWKAWLIGAGFVYVDHYYRPAGLPCAQQPWLASVWRKP